MRGASRIVGKLRAPKGADGIRRPLYLTEVSPPVMLWELSDEEALALGSAVGAFGKYVPMSDEQSAIAVDCARLAQVLVEITQARLMIERMHFASTRMEQERIAKTEFPPGEPNVNGAAEPPVMIVADRRRNLS